MIPMSFFEEMMKLAGRAEAKLFRELVTNKNWPEFEKNLDDPTFRRAGVRSNVADAKMRRYLRAMGNHIQGDELTSVQGTKPQPYSLRRGYNGRLTCSCPSWQYVHSHGGTDCKHIKAYKESQKQQAEAQS
jgi:hypothetical protein